MATPHYGSRRLPDAERARITDPGWIERFAVAQRAATIEAARSVAYAVVAGWWNAVLDGMVSQPTWRLRPPPAEVGLLSNEAASEARDMGADLARLSPSEASSLVGRLYTRCLPPDLRTANGVFYTPVPLVELLLDRAEQAGHAWHQGNVLDPSCGGGAFLVQAADRIMAAMAGAAPAIIAKALSTRIVGWEIDPFAAWLAQVSIDVVTLPVTSQTGRMLNAAVQVRNSLTTFEDGLGVFDLVIGNPPFGKIKDNVAIRSTFGRSLYGHPNLYGLFTDLAIRLAKPESGRVAYLTPGSFLAGHYFKRLRGLLAKECPPVSIDFVTSRRGVFDDVLQEVVLSTFERGRESRRVHCRSVVARASGLEAISTGYAEISLGDSPWILPRSVEDGPMVAAMARMPARLADWGYSVSTGPLVWNRHKDRLFDRGAVGRIPVVWAEAVQRDGKFSLEGVRRGHKAWFAPRTSDAAMLVTRPCVLVQRTTATEQHRRLISAALPQSLLREHGQITVENHLNMVVATTAKPVVPPGALARFMRSVVADRVLRCINASVAVSASELEAMPLPSAADLLTALRGKNPEAELRRLYS